MVIRFKVDKRSTRLVEEERALSKMINQNKQQENLPLHLPEENLLLHLPKEIIYSILERLPLESLQSSMYVCQQWYKMINSSFFINALIHRSETVLIFLARSCPYSNIFSVETNLSQSQSVPQFDQPNRKYTPQFRMQFMEIKDGKSTIRELKVTCWGAIRATCNGLILLSYDMERKLVVLNPVTKKLIAFPFGTLFPPDKESYGLVFCNYTSEYKLIHLFQDELNYIGCEIFGLGTRSWRMVDGPPFGLFSWLGCKPVSAIGALHWVPKVDRSDFLLSLSTADENFHKIPLPKRSRKHDGIVEMGGLLSFMTNEDYRIDIWILSNLNGKDWIKQHSITVGCSMEMIPLYCSRIRGEIIFKGKHGYLYAYDFERMVKVDMPHKFSRGGCYFPHVNTHVSWHIKEKDENP